MCGIIFLVNPGGLTVSDMQKFRSMFLKCEDRGTDAAGAFSAISGEIVTVKSPVKASKFLKSKAYKRFEKEVLLKGSNYVVGHCRQATRGSPYNNINNHPIGDSLNFALVHNGIVDCDKYDKTPERSDTWIFAHAISSYLKSEKGKSFYEIAKKAFEDVSINSKHNSSVIVAANASELCVFKCNSMPLVFQISGNRVIGGSTKAIAGFESNSKKTVLEKEVPCVDYFDVEEYSGIWFRFIDGKIYWHPEMLECLPKPVPVRLYRSDLDPPVEKKKKGKKKVKLSFSGEDRWAGTRYPSFFDEDDKYLEEEAFCDGCGKPYPEDQLVFFMNDDRLLCPSCIPEISCASCNMAMVMEGGIFCNYNDAEVYGTEAAECGMFDPSKKEVEGEI